ncbi:TetR/AcrR family transcriptional regulator [Bailinhaonella thermotolerans]|uniref:TetR/AcrR family transcriptional regulator n=1 Tax=Bailinhaonella thermotolerans TaxID=1070861 RepID=A0A3A4B4J8_9ACTN|nr:TetR/AcrR family transcriptional regulator [Bailinhaonella thermotolerans]RJL36081.1 TetR/AcrR family transcriptional regulator [Bailinhaonella thermotolerans]
MADDQGRRAHTGRRRNEEAARAILRAARELLERGDGAGVSVDAIAAAAGVGKQTIYRWWPSKSDLLLDALVEGARGLAPAPDEGDLGSDLAAFLTATFRGARDPAVAAALRQVAAEAQRDPRAAGLLRSFTEDRRRVLRGLLERAAARGELSPAADLDLLVDQAYGVLWYRLLIGHAPLTEAAAAALAAALARQATASP